MRQTKMRFIFAGAIPFLCIFCQTLLQYNAMFALGGMVNHTLADWETMEEWTESMRMILEGKKPNADTCTDRKLNMGHDDIEDGPFPWDSAIEGFINSIINVGSVIGILMVRVTYVELYIH